MIARCLAAFVLWVALLVACNSLTAGLGSACDSAGGTCVVNTPTMCLAQAPSSAQDCNTSSAPNPGGLACCLIMVMDAGDAGDAADAFDAHDAEDADAEDAEDVRDAREAGDGPDGTPELDAAGFDDAANAD